MITIVVLAAAAYGFYALLHRTNPAPFVDFTITQITNNGKIVGAAISPDGKYLLSVIEDKGKQSLWLHHIPTNSDTQVLAPADASYRDLISLPTAITYTFEIELRAPSISTARRFWGARRNPCSMTSAAV